MPFGPLMLECSSFNFLQRKPPVKLRRRLTLILHIVRFGMLSPDRPEHDRMAGAGVLVDLLGQTRREDMRLPPSTDARARAAALRLQDSPGKADRLTHIASEKRDRPSDAAAGLSTRNWPHA